MNKLFLIIKREYLTRVTSRTFLLATFLTPIAFALFIVVAGFIFQYQSDDTKTIAIIDEANVLNKRIADDANLYFKFIDGEIGSIQNNLEDYDFDGFLVIPELNGLYSKRHTIYYYSDDAPSLDIETLIKSRISKSIRDYKITALNIDKSQLEALDTRIDLEPEPLTEGAADATSITGAIGAMLGLAMGFIMYLTIFIYGMMIMRSVMEEKTNRIVEVMISSVKPFQLMLGKIIGVGGVGLTQFAIWAILIPLIVTGANLIFGFDTGNIEVNAPANIDPDDLQAKVALAMDELGKQNWWMILPLFILYFLGGYFLYSSLFAAVGSAIGDDIGEGQSLTIPITIPVVLALYIMIKAIEAPNSSLAVWSSIFPLFSPIVMPARLAFNPPIWEVLLSVVLLIAASLFFIWLSGRIYRVGILLYGKKASLLEIGKWIFRRD